MMMVNIQGTVHACWMLRHNQHFAFEPKQDQTLVFIPRKSIANPCIKWIEENNHRTSPMSAPSHAFMCFRSIFFWTSAEHEKQTCNLNMDEPKSLNQILYSISAPSLLYNLTNGTEYTAMMHTRPSIFSFFFFSSSLLSFLPSALSLSFFLARFHCGFHFVVCSFCNTDNLHFALDAHYAPHRMADLVNMERKKEVKH